MAGDGALRNVQPASVATLERDRVSSWATADFDWQARIAEKHTSPIVRTRPHRLTIEK